LASAQFGGAGDNPYGGGNPYSNGGDDGGRPDSASGGQFGAPPRNMNRMVTAHAALATVAFGLLFPSGSILIRLGSFRGCWLVHGIIQAITYLLYLVAAGIGVYMATHTPSGVYPSLLTHAHPGIGMFLLALIFFQPILGLVHHFAFKKYNRRVVWSHAHIWIGRFAVTLGIVNGGLGLQLSAKLGFYAPHTSTVIGYSVAAGIIWLIWVAAAVYGEIKRRRQLKQAPPEYKEERAVVDDGNARNA
jgi:hypothetical protein